MSPAPPLSGVKCPLLLLVVMTSFSHCLSSNTTIHYYVHPDNSSTHLCPALSVICETLDYYSSVLHSLNDSDVVLCFLPGDHILREPLTLSSASSLTLTSLKQDPNSVVIDCRAHIYLSYMERVAVRELTFTTRDIKYQAFNTPTLGLRAVAGFSLTDSILTHFTDIFLQSLSTEVEVNISLVSNTMAGNRIGSGLFRFLNSSVHFSGNTVQNNTFESSVMVYEKSSVSLIGNVFVNNTGLEGCISPLILANSSIICLWDNTFVQTKGPVFFSFSSVLSFKGHIEFSGNLACYGTIVAAGRTVLMFGGSTSFVNNTATILGGAMLLTRQAKMHLQQNSSVLFDGNMAGNRGGALYLDGDSDCSPGSENICFMEYESETFSIVFQNNRAVRAGDSIYYGGAITACQLNAQRHQNILLPQNDAATSSVSSDPTQLCLCNDTGIVCCPSGDPSFSESCAVLQEAGTVYPGQKVTLQVVAVGQTFGTTPATVSSYLATNNNMTRQLVYTPTLSHNLENSPPTLATLNASCTAIHYSLNSVNEYEDIVLFPSGVCRVYSKLRVRVHINTSCPPGFELSQESNSCICETRLRELNSSIAHIFCDINHEAIQHFGSIWVGYSTKYNSQSHLILHKGRCPLDYCTVRQQVTFSLNNTDAQCRYNRSGLLCGRCSEGLSTVFGGTSQCKECSNTHLALLVPFAVAGIALVAFLFLLRFTVSYGTLNGLIFYANVVQVNRRALFPAGQTNILTVFIAWLNLDLGIETCFYNGMDAYSQTWLQFVFPFYILGLAALIVLISNRSRRVTKILGSNPVAVLATLFLLSYLEIFRTISAVLFLTTLEYPEGALHTVWALDGNVPFVSKKYLGLFCFTVAILLVFFIPLTIFLLIGQSFYSCKIKGLSWSTTLRLRALLEAYYAPYKWRHRYWFGLLLVTRVGITVLVFVSVGNIKSIIDQAFVVISGIICLVFLGLIWGWLMQGIHQKWYLDLLDGSFLINLGILSLVTYNNLIVGGEQGYATYTSVGIAFVTFIGIVVYHVYLIVHRTETVQSCIANRVRKPTVVDAMSRDINERNRSTTALRESLLEGDYTSTSL